MREQSIELWKWLRERNLEGRWKGPLIFVKYYDSPHEHQIQDADGWPLVKIILRWSPTSEEIATYLNTAEVYYADDIQQESNHVR